MDEQPYSTNFSWAYNRDLGTEDIRPPRHKLFAGYQLAGHTEHCCREGFQVTSITHCFGA